MPLTTDELNNTVNSTVARLVWLSAHTGDPGETGAHEVTDSDYSRQQITWNPADFGGASGTQESFNVPAGEYTHMGFWDSQTGGVFRGGEAFDTPSTLDDPGILRITPNLALAPYVPVP